ncbi:MAG: alginate lyase family protein [Stenotrophobium sp.]
MKLTSHNRLQLRALLFACSVLAGSSIANAANAGVATGDGATVLVNAADISSLRRHKDAFTAILRGCTEQLDYAPAPVPVFAPDPHYTGAGINDSANNGKQLADDAHAAYRAGLCFLITGEQRYAATAQHILDAWAGTLTQVPTHQGKDGVNFDLPYMIMAASWVRGAGDWNSAAFDRFLRQTVLPVSQAENPNNHGAWGVLMEASAAAYLGDTQRLSAAQERWQRLMQGAVAADGSLPREIQRSGTSNWRGGPDKGVKGIAYTHYFLLPVSLAAKIFADQGQPVWNSSGGHLLQAAFNRAAAWTLYPQTFPYYASNGGHLEGVRNAAYFALLLQVYPDKDAETVLGQGDVGMDGFCLLELFGNIQ